MNKDTLSAAIQEAERFVKIAKDCRNTGEPYKDAAGRHLFTSYQPKQSGATKRASMDLTRALADMRRPS